MPTLTLKTYTAHPAGTFRAKITGIEEDQAQHGPIYKIDFETERGECRAIVSAKYSVKSKLGKLVECAFGKAPVSLELDDLIGRELRIVVEHREEDGATYDRVTDFRPISGDPFQGE